MNRFILWAAIAFGCGLVARVVDAATTAKPPQIVKASYDSGASLAGSRK